MKRIVEGLPISVQVRLARHARATGLDPNLVLTRFALERFLYRLSKSPHADRFVLKGALLMLVWLGETIRPTRDGDLLGYGDLSQASLTRILGEVCAVAVLPDGLEFLSASIRVVPIRPENAYGGMRATLDARLGKARLRVQIDVGSGDAVTPEPEWLEYPCLLEFPRPRLRAYRPETAIAEKLHAMVVLGEANSRMRDFFDIFALAERRRFEGRLLAQAVRATFERRRTPVPATPPLALRPEFGALRDKQVQWQGFLRKNGLSSVPVELGPVVARLSEFLTPVITAARRTSLFGDTWRPGGPWKAAR
jgi:predicted nucleotidyltransferase component of viral defense system